MENLQWEEENIRILKLKAEAAVRKHRMEEQKLNQQTARRGFKNRATEGNQKKQSCEDGTVNLPGNPDRLDRSSKRTAIELITRRSTSQQTNMQSEKEHVPMAEQVAGGVSNSGERSESRRSLGNRQSSLETPAKVARKSSARQLLEELEREADKAQRPASESSVDPSRPSQDPQPSLNRESFIADIVEVEGQLNISNDSPEGPVHNTEDILIGDASPIGSNGSPTLGHVSSNLQSTVTRGEQVQHRGAIGQRPHGVSSNVDLLDSFRNLIKTEELAAASQSVHTIGNQKSEPQLGPQDDHHTTAVNLGGQDTKQTLEALGHGVQAHSPTPEIVTNSGHRRKSSKPEAFENMEQADLNRPSQYLATSNGLLESWIFRKVSTSEQGRTEPSWSKSDVNFVPISQRKLKRHVLAGKLRFRDVMKQYTELDTSQQEMISALISRKAMHTPTTNYDWELISLETKPTSASGSDIEAIHIILKLNHGVITSTEMPLQKDVNQGFVDAGHNAIAPYPEDFNLRPSMHTGCYDSLEDHDVRLDGNIFTRLWARRPGYQPKSRLCKDCLGQFQKLYGARFIYNMCCSKCRKIHVQRINTFHSSLRIWQEQQLQQQQIIAEYGQGMQIPGGNLNKASCSRADRQRLPILQESAKALRISNTRSTGHQNRIQSLLAFGGAPKTTILNSDDESFSDSEAVTSRRNYRARSREERQNLEPTTRREHPQISCALEICDEAADIEATSPTSLWTSLSSHRSYKSHEDVLSYRPNRDINRLITNLTNLGEDQKDTKRRSESRRRPQRVRRGW